MILAPVEEAARYAALHPLFATALAWLDTAAALRSPPGRYPLGDELTVNVDEYTTRPASQCRFESHRRFIDIQVLLQGSEAIEWAPVAALELEQDFAADGDVAFYRSTTWPATRLRLAPSVLALFFPSDGHRPCIALAQPEPVRKMVFKLPVVSS